MANKPDRQAEPESNPTPKQPPRPPQLIVKVDFDLNGNMYPSGVAKLEAYELAKKDYLG